MDETTSVSKLVIESAEPEDEGMYVCLATNVAGSNIENAALTVNGQLEFRVSTMLNNFESWTWSLVILVNLGCVFQYRHLIIY